MAAITDFPSLQDAVEEYLARTDLSEYLPNFVQVTESWLNRKLRTRDMMASAGLAADSVINGAYGLPVDYLEWVAVLWADPVMPARPLSLRYVEPDSAEFRHRHRPNGSPQYFTVLDNELQTRSMKPGRLTLSYYRRIPAITAAEPTNWLIGSAPELYLYGVLAEAYRFQKDESRSKDWADQAGAFLLALTGQGDSQKVARRPARTAEDAAAATARATPN